MISRSILAVAAVIALSAAAATTQAFAADEPDATVCPRADAPTAGAADRTAS